MCCMRTTWFMIGLEYIAARRAKMNVLKNKIKKSER